VFCQDHVRDSSEPRGQAELVEGQKVLQMYGIEVQGSQPTRQRNAQSIATERIAPRNLQVYDLDAIVSAARNQWAWRSIECPAQDVRTALHEAPPELNSKELRSPDAEGVHHFKYSG
jgi:hypothetical protein